MQIERTARTIATLIAIAGTIIAFHVYTKNIPLTIMFVAIMISLGLHVTTFDRIMELRDDFRRELADIRKNIVTKREFSGKLSILASVIFNVSNTLVDFLAVRGIIGQVDVSFLRSSLSGYRAIVSRVLNPLRLSKKEKEAILRIMDLPLEEITEEDCDIAYEALKREMLEGSIEAAEMLSILIWIRAYIKYGRKRGKRDKQHEKNPINSIKSFPQSSNL